ncbi:type I-F CRISPR-associated protein Csy3 [Catenovulum maritimum]|uniref:Type I-F CRISPR-associated protein Csy3 n=1 Tax=Catenovulum maritimum TaxID=1513271 RepID=A0A0J8GZT9_9ALTE|nr:type I-F CRISPR-associated protein Csy3 [Catenovulum maritimum]KMT66749.1 hypothetical protein XM47_01085 [Catenovulum maritimum]
MRLPNKLAYTRSLSPSIAIFLAVDAEGNKTPLSISTVKLIGQKSSASEAFNKDTSIKPTANVAKLVEGNPHTVEYCNVPYDCETLLCKFSLRINANSITPSNCNDDDVAKALKQFSIQYENAGGYRYLAKRYIENLLNGAWLWRNIDAPSIDIKITSHIGVSVIVENVNLHKFDDNFPNNIDGYEELLTITSEALINPQKCIFLEVEAKIKPSLLQEIHPSQAFTDKGNPIGRVYQDTVIGGNRTPILGSYKIGAALAMIDDWYLNAENRIRVGAFGVIKERNTSVRHPETGSDIYTILMRTEKITQQLGKENLETQYDAHFLAANLVKGGLFQLGR